MNNFNRLFFKVGTAAFLFRRFKRLNILFCIIDWQECFDEQTGFPYYWHTETNQVTWEIPPELKLFQEQTHKEPASSHGPQIPAWSKIPPNSCMIFLEFILLF